MSARGGSSGNGRSSANGRAQNGSSGQGGYENEGLMKLFLHQLADIYYVEKQLMKVLPRMADKALSDEVGQAFLDHTDETEQQMERLEEVFEILGRTARGKRCEAMDGILDEAKEMMDEFKDDEALDAALICAAQKVEHYEITTYGSMCAFAEELGLNDVVELLEQTLEEEKMTDEKLTEIAEAAVNARAQGGGGDGMQRGDGAQGRNRGQSGEEGGEEEGEEEYSERGRYANA